MHSDDTMTIEQVAELAGLGIRSVRRAVSDKEISFELVPSGRTRKSVFHRAEVERWISERKEKRTLVPRIEDGPEHDDNEVPFLAPSRDTLQSQRPAQLALPGAEAFVEQIGQAVGKAVADAVKSPAVPLADKRTLSVAEASRLFGVPEAMIRDAHRDGALNGRKIGRGLRFLPADLDAFISALFAG